MSKGSRQKMGSMWLPIVALLAAISIALCPAQWKHRVKSIAMSNWPQSDPSLSIEFECSSQKYTTEILSLDPLVVYIRDFVSKEEIEELLELGYVDITLSQWSCRR